MPDKPPTTVLENRFAVPPAFAATWLTDFQPDDGKKWFQFDELASVSRTGSTFHVEGNIPRMGRNVNDITIDSPTTWHSDGRMMNKRGKVMSINHLEESVEPDGNGTVHRVRMWMGPQGFFARFMFALARGSMIRSLNSGFARMKTAMEAEYAASSGTGPRS